MARNAFGVTAWDKGLAPRWQWQCAKPFPPWGLWTSPCCQDSTLRQPVGGDALGLGEQDDGVLLGTPSEPHHWLVCIPKACSPALPSPALWQPDLLPAWHQLMQAPGLPAASFWWLRQQLLCHLTPAQPPAPLQEPHPHPLASPCPRHWQGRMQP